MTSSTLVGAALGLLAGVGLLLVWRSGPRAPRRRTPTVSGWTRRRTLLLAEAGVGGVSSTQLLALQALAGFASALLVLLATSSVSISTCFAVFGFAVPIGLVRRLRRTRTADLREVWPEAVDNLASAVRAGLSLPEALSALSVRGPEPLRPAFAAFAADYRASGRFMSCLDQLKQRLSDPVGDRVCETLRIAREVGGTDLGTVLRTLSRFLREDGRVRAELAARQGWTVNAARIAVTAPWVVLLLLGTQSTTLDAYDSPTGLTVLAIGAAVCVVAYRLMLRVSRLPDEHRMAAA